MDFNQAQIAAKEHPKFLGVKNLKVMYRAWDTLKRMHPLVSRVAYDSDGIG